MRNLRLIFVSFLVFLLTGFIIWRVIDLQILKGEMYRAFSEGIFGPSNYLQKERGEIFFRGGEKLAGNITSPFVLVNAKKVRGNEKIIKSLSEILNLDKNFIIEKLREREGFFILKRKLSQEELKNLKRAKLEGVFIEEEKIRFYPYEELAAHLLGFVNIEGEGQYGLEQYYNEILKEGENLYLTLDYNVQFKTKELLKKAKEALAIEGGEIIVIDPNSGEILGLSQFPFFNPNKYQEEENFEVFINKATQRFFEPGSIFKLIIMAAAIEEGKITPETTYVDKGFVKIGGWEITNFENKVWGKRTMTEVLEWSINTGAVFVKRKLGHQLFLKYLEKFGIFEKTKIDLPETHSENKEFKKGYEINFATASFGQGIEVSPIQLVRALSAIANGGKLITPHLLLTKKNLPEKRVISPETSLKLTQMAVSVVENGYGRRAKIPGYHIAGKTGTSQIPFSFLGIEKRGYSDKTWQSFVGWFPAFNPKFLILIKLDNPQAVAAEVSTTLIARELMEYLLTYYQIPPDYE